jgi:hypothetical protein
LRETLRRRRASGGPAEQTFATVVGLELRPRRLRAASELWRLLTEQRGVEGRDALWAHPDLIPTADDLDDPAAFVARADGTDPIAELEKLANDEAPPEEQPATRGEGRRRRVAEMHVSGASQRLALTPLTRISRLFGALDVLAVDALQPEPGGGREALQVTHRPLRAGIAVHPRPEPLVVAGLQAGG